MNKEVYWRATTEHGTTYTYRGGSIFVDSEKHGQYPIRASLGIKLVDRDYLESLDTDKEAWKAIREAEFTDIPVVGKSIYIANFSEWRLSTEVVKLEILEDEDVDLT